MSSLRPSLASTTSSRGTKVPSFMIMVGSAAFLTIQHKASCFIRARRQPRSAHGQLMHTCNCLTSSRESRRNSNEQCSCPTHSEDQQVPHRSFMSADPGPDWQTLDLSRTNFRAGQLLNLTLCEKRVLIGRRDGPQRLERSAGRLRSRRISEGLRPCTARYCA